MLANPNGKLLVCASELTTNGERLEPVRTAAGKMAETLRLDIEVVTSGKQFAPIYVFYKNGDEEPIPIYCDKGENPSIQEICAALRNMMFVLSFHPKNPALRSIRKEIMRFS
jgi:hypothetical protein